MPEPFSLFNLYVGGKGLCGIGYELVGFGLRKVGFYRKLLGEKVDLCRYYALLGLNHRGKLRCTNGTVKSLDFILDFHNLLLFAKSAFLFFEQIADGAPSGLFLYMLQRLFNNIPYMVIGKGVKDVFAGFSVGHEGALP